MYIHTFILKRKKVRMWTLFLSDDGEQCKIMRYCDRRNFRAVHIFAHFAQAQRCAKI